MNHFGRGPPKDRLCEIISKLDPGFRRSCHLSQLLTDRRRTKTDHKSSPCHYMTGELKSMQNDQARSQSIPYKPNNGGR